MDDPIERLLLVDDDVLRAVVAWTALAKHPRHADNLVEWAPGVYYDFRLWMRVARLREDDHAAIASRCRTLGFIDEGGEVWPLVITIARNAAARQIKAKTKAETK